MDKTSLEEAPLPAIGLKTLQELILSFKLINTVSQLKLQEETSTVELWDMPAKARPKSSLTEFRVSLGNL